MRSSFWRPFRGKGEVRPGLLRRIVCKRGPGGARTGRRLLSVEGMERRLVLSQTVVGLEMPPHVPNQVLVQYRGPVEDTTVTGLRSRVGALGWKELTPPPTMPSQGRLELLDLPAGANVHRALAILQADAAVQFAEPNWIYTHFAKTKDPYYIDGLLWGMYGDATTPTNAFGSQAGEAWEAGFIGSKSIYVGIIDEGVMHSHEDLRNNIWMNPFDPPDGIDNDGNGYADDLRGWDFENTDNTTYDGTFDDHGTHVAGTIGAVGWNNKGVVGVNWKVNLITAKFLGQKGGTLANAIQAIDYLTDLKLRHGLNIVATNNSWGGGGYSQGLFDAIERANAANILFIAAAGNGGSDGVGDDNDVTPTYPASYTNSNIIAVASITSKGAMSKFSNYGPNSVHLGAPGSGINSTLPTTAKYGSYSGTSMATPHVTGAVALYASRFPQATAAQIKDAILSSAAPTPSLSGRTVSGGRLDISRLLGLATGKTQSLGHSRPPAGSTPPASSDSPTPQVIGTLQDLEDLGGSPNDSKSKRERSPFPNLV